MVDNKGMDLEKMSSVISINEDHMNTSSTLKLAENDVIQKNNKNISISKSELDLYDPFENRDKTNATPDAGALIHLVKSSLGSGILAMPAAFMHGGLIFGIVGTIIVGIICTHCVNLLVYCSQRLAARVKRPSLGFAETAETAFLSGPEKYRKYAGVARAFVNLSLFAAYYFGNTVYVVLIATSFKQVVENQTDFEMNIRWYILLTLIPLLPLGIIRTLRVLVPFTAAATFMVMFGLAITLYYTFVDLPSFDSVDYITHPVEWPLFFSTVLFAMEGIGTVLPIENSMENPQRFLGCPGVLNIAMTIVVSLYTAVGFFGFLKYGKTTQGSITLNLPPDSILAEGVKLLIAVSVLCSYGLQFSVPSEIIWSKLGPKLSESKQVSGYYIMRGLMICGTIIVAIIVPELGPFISLVGAICFSSLGLFCPAIIEMITLSEVGYGKFNWLFYKDIFLIIISIVALVFGTFASLEEIVASYTSGK